MIGWALRQLAILAGVAVLLYWGVGHRLIEHRHAPAAAVVAAQSQAVAAEPPAAVPNTLIFRANRQGHVILDGYANGAPVRFLVDTGATFVALSRSDAAAAGLRDSDLRFRVLATTANGQVHVAPVRLRALRVGQFEVDDVEAVVMDNLSISLLGQSFLRRLDSYEMKDGVLTLSWD